MDTNQLTRDQLAALRSLANRLTLKARDHAGEAKRKGPNDPQSEYLRGLAEGYYKAAVELADILKGKVDTAADSGMGTPSEKSASSAADSAQSSSQFEQVPLDEVIRILNYANVNPRDIAPNRDNTFVAIFSRWQPLTDQERLDKLKQADPRIYVLSNGRNHDTSDPFVRFGFRKR
jgi:hypothetical protein